MKWLATCTLLIGLVGCCPRREAASLPEQVAHPEPVAEDWCDDAFTPLASMPVDPHAAHPNDFLLLDDWMAFAGRAAAMGERERKVALLDAKAALKMEDHFENRLRLVVLAGMLPSARNWQTVRQNLDLLGEDPCLPEQLRPWLQVLETRARQSQNLHNELQRLRRSRNEMRRQQADLEKKIEALSRIETEMSRQQTPVDEKEQAP